VQFNDAILDSQLVGTKDAQKRARRPLFVSAIAAATHRPKAEAQVWEVAKRLPPPKGLYRELVRSIRFTYYASARPQAQANATVEAT
jgi:hypothetical protein